MSTKYPERKLTYADLRDFDKQLDFPIPILPGDASLIEPFITDLGCDFAKRVGFLQDSIRITVISLILFKLVVLRTYLARPPENDLDIYELVRDGKVSRIWTHHEQALAACAGEEDTSAHAEFSVNAALPSVWKVQVIHRSEIPFAHDGPLVSLNASSISSSKRPGLTGGDRKPRHYLPPHLRNSPSTCPRPKPRPIKRTQSTKEDTASDLDRSTPNSQVVSDLGQTAVTQAVELLGDGDSRPPSKRRNLKSVSMPPAELRRSTRVRKTAVQ